MSTFLPQAEEQHLLPSPEGTGKRTECRFFVILCPPASTEGGQCFLPPDLGCQPNLSAAPALFAVESAGFQVEGTRLSILSFFLFGSHVLPRRESGWLTMSL